MTDRGDTVVDIDDELVSSIHQKLQVIGGEPVKTSHTIYRVVPWVRKMGGGAYDPKVISIGPFHRMKEALLPMEQVKWRFLGDLIGRRPENSLEKFIQELKSLEGQARSCYSEQVVPDDSNAFVEMMLLDGCFIIEFLLEWCSRDDKTSLHKKVKWNLPILRNDLLLLENQIPFFVLQSLFNLSVTPFLEGDRTITLTDVALCYLDTGSRAYPSNPSDMTEVHHLLHLFHSSLRPTISSSIRSEATKCIKCAIKPTTPEETSRKPTARLRMIPSATELRRVGMMFKKKKTRCFINITYSNGTMAFPQLLIDAETLSLFRNLIAFEQFCPTAGNHFTAYATLMNNLINTPGDVALLESYGILESYEEVSGFFNTLAHGAYLDYDNHHLLELSRRVKSYSKRFIYRRACCSFMKCMLNAAFAASTSDAS